MADRAMSLEERVECLAAEVQSLSARVDELTVRLGEGLPVAKLEEAPVAASVAVDPYPTGEPTEMSEEILDWAGKASLLPRLATLCFLLVVALILRTLTDSGLLNTLVGSGIGMSYAAILMVTGWYKYRKQSPLAPVFAACGMILISTIVVETHARYQSLPLVPAYFTLMLSSIGMAIISYQFNVFIPVSVGTLSMCLAGVALDYPNPFFPYLAMILITANWLGFYAARLKRCAWLRWSVLVVSMAMLQMWSFKLGMALYRHQEPTPALALDWFLPVVGAFFVSYLAEALLGILRTGSDRISRFDFSLPTINGLWLFLVAWYVVGAWGKSVLTLGLVGVVAAAGHLAMALWLAQRRAVNAPGTNSFVFAGGILLAVALPAATGKALFALPVISAMALGLAFMSHRWSNGAVRITTYVFQSYACAALVVLLSGKDAAALNGVNAVPAILIGGISLAHYVWCRSQNPPEHAPFFLRYDKKDRSGVLLVLAALISAFFALRVGAFQLLQGRGVDAGPIFSSVQSVIINLSAIGLMVFALTRRNKELRNVAIFVTVAGGVKVFLYDLMGIHGVPLVLSVFSFGLAAALESVVLGRWPRTEEQKEESPIVTA